MSAEQTSELCFHTTAFFYKTGEVWVVPSWKRLCLLDEHAGDLNIPCYVAPQIQQRTSFDRELMLFLLETVNTGLNLDK